MSRVWPALVVEARALDDPPDAEDRLLVLLDDHSLHAIEDLVERPLPPDSPSDSTSPPIQEPTTPLRWRVFFSTAQARDEAAREICTRLPRLIITTVDVENEDWAARSQASLASIRAGRFVIAPPWDVPEVAEPGTTVVIIEPSMGFGTGHHPTTRLCLRLLSEVALERKRVLDIGTGSGVLAMAAALSGAADVVAIDVDEDAIASARASAALNTLPPGIRFEVADYRETPPTPAEVVIANLTGGMLRTTSDSLNGLVDPGGILIVSGFDVLEEPDVRSALAPLCAIDRLEEESWVAIKFGSAPVHRSGPECF